MALIKLKPTSPGTRFVVRVDRWHLHKGGPYEPLTVRQNKTGARNHSGRITTRHIGGGSRQKYRIIDFRRDKDGIAGRGRAHRIRSEPHRAHRADLLRRRRAPLHPRAQGPEGWRRSALGQRGADQARQRHGAAPHPGGLAGAQHRAEARPRRAAGAQRRQLGQYASREGHARVHAPQVRRDAQGAHRLPRDDRRGRQRRAQPAQLRQGRAPSAGAASARRCAAWR